MKTATVTLSNGHTVQAETIEDMNTYRGFYVILPNGTYVRNSFNSAGFETGYKNGFDTNGKSVIEYLYEKLSSKEKLSKNEKLAFYESVNLFNPIARIMGTCYDFSTVLNKVFGIGFYTLESKLSRTEREMFNEHSMSSFVDIDLLVTK